MNEEHATMMRPCFFCGREMSARQRATPFCSLRCQEQFHRMYGPDAPGAAATGKKPPPGSLIKAIAPAAGSKHRGKSGD